MDNLDDYLLSFQHYKDGNYEYETITSLDDIKKAIIRGKKFVFIISGAKGLIIIGLIFLSLAFILTAILNYAMVLLFDEFLLFVFFSSLLIFGFFLGPSLIALIPGLRRLRKSFMVLGPEGIVYKKKFGIKGFNWEKISIGFYRTTLEVLWRTTKMTKTAIDSFRVNTEIEFLDSFLIVISMPNGDSLEFGRGDYTMKEFPDKKQIGRVKANALFLLTFANYYNYGKKGMFEPPN